MLASPESTVSFTQTGEITVSGSGSLLIQSYDSHASSLDAFHARVLRNCSPEYLRLIGTFNDHIFLASPHRAPVKVVAIPLSPSPSDSADVTLKLSTLAALMDDVSEFALFTPSNLNVHFFTPDNMYETISLRVPSSGGEFTIAPLYTLKSSANPAEGVQFCVLSPHAPALADAEDLLPTPPPSPHLRPVAHLSHLKTTNVNSSGTSIISEIGILSSAQESPEAALSPSETDGATPTQQQQIQTNRSSSLISVRSANGATQRNTFLQYMRYLFLATAIFFTALFHTFFGAKKADSEAAEVMDGASESEGTEEVDERTPLLAHVEQAPPPPAPPVVTPVLPVESSEPEPSHITAQPYVPIPSPALPPPKPSSLSFDLFFTSGNVSFIQKDIGDIPSSHKLVVETNGKPSEHRVATLLGPGIELLEFDTGLTGKKTSGRIKFELVL